MKAADARVLLLRDLDGMIAQLMAYPDEALLWRETKGISNAPGNLGLHVAGNLQAFIGAVLGNTGYERDRQAEFDARNLPRTRVISELEKAKQAVDQTLKNINESRINAPYPMNLGDIQPTTGRFLAHLCGHLAYHLGQVDTHRRMVTGDGAIPGIQSLKALGQD